VRLVRGHGERRVSEETSHPLPTVAIATDDVKVEESHQLLPTLGRVWALATASRCSTECVSMLARAPWGPQGGCRFPSLAKL